MLKAFVVVVIFLCLSAQAQESTENSSASEMGPIRVIGSSQEELSKPNSAHFVGKEKLEQQQQTDVTRVLKQVPGVYVQEEDGFGLRPNIGLRGTHPHRSRKIVLLEDGILIGPAPYSAPAAYYTPFMSKIESLEVFKGVASTIYGPNSIGGAINYLTRSLPQETRAELELAGGSFNTQKYRGNAAYISDRWGMMFEGTHFQTQGFKKLDSGRDTGFDKNDFLLKGRALISEDGRQEIQWKLSHADEISDETYLGLTQDDFKKDPYRRYAASARDEMDWDHQQYQLTYKNQITDNFALWTTAYHNKFHRNWSRFNNFRNSAIVVNDVLKNPYANGTNQLYYDILTGQQDSSAAGSNGDLVMANNDRYFHSQGLQLNTFSIHNLGATEHQLSLGLRYHEDQIFRNHSEDLFSMQGKTLIKTLDPRKRTADITDKSQAVTVTATDEMSWNSWKFTFSARYENVDYDSNDILTSANKTRSDRVFVPGAGALYKFTDNLSAFAGINKGVTLVGPSGAGSEQPEESTNYETGVRYLNPDQAFFAEGILFLADYSNIKGTCSFSAGCTGPALDQSFDGGKAQIYGLESRVTQGFQWDKVFLPISLSVTLTEAHFAATTQSTNPEWGNGTIENGDPLPYVPKAQYSLSLGTEYKQYTQEVILSWVSQMYDQAVVAGREEIPAYGVVDWSGKYKLSKDSQVYARVDNILNNEYMTSLRPFGARPGKAQSFLVGYKHSF